MIAERQGTILTADLVRRVRELFEVITSHVPAPTMTGWEVSMGTDEVLEADIPR